MSGEMGHMFVYERGVAGWLGGPHVFVNRVGWVDGWVGHMCV